MIPVPPASQPLTGSHDDIAVPVEHRTDFIGYSKEKIREAWSKRLVLCIGNSDTRNVEVQRLMKGFPLDGSSLLGGLATLLTLRSWWTRLHYMKIDTIQSSSHVASLITLSEAGRESTCLVFFESLKLNLSYRLIAFVIGRMRTPIDIAIEEYKKLLPVMFAKHTLEDRSGESFHCFDGGAGQIGKAAAFEEVFPSHRWASKYRTPNAQRRRRAYSYQWIRANEIHSSAFGSEVRRRCLTTQFLNLLSAPISIGHSGATIQ